MNQKNTNRSGLGIMARLIVLVGPLLPFMVLAVALGVAGFLCATAITVLGGWSMLNVLGQEAPMSFILLFHFLVLAAVLRGFLRYGEQACNHFIAFKLLALVRDKVFAALLNWRAVTGATSSPSSPRTLSCWRSFTPTPSLPPPSPSSCR